MPSTLVLVSVNGGPFNPTGLNGLNVTPGGTIAVTLQSPAGVTNWYLQVGLTVPLSNPPVIQPNTGTDETQVSPPPLTGVNGAGLVTGGPTSTVTFTFPGPGTTLLFSSTVTGVTTITTTFGLFALTGSGYRVGASGMSREGSAAYGWAAITNPAIRQIGNSPTPAHILYVSVDGNDVTGDGSIGNPYASYTTAAAAAVLGGAVESAFWAVYCGPGTYAASGPDRNLLLVPAVILMGDPSQLTKFLSATVGLSAAWATSSLQGGGIQNIAFEDFSGTVLDFNAAGATEAYLTLISCSIPNLSIIGVPGSPPAIEINYNVIGAASFQDIQLSSNLSEFPGLTFTGTGAGANWGTSNDEISGNLLLTGSAGVAVTTFGSPFIGALTIDQPASTYTGTLGSVPTAGVTFTGGATSAQYTISPTLSGSSPPITNVYYVSTTGSDVTGDGSIGNPFATYANAATVALAQASPPSGTNPVTVVFAPGTYTENVALQPYISLSGWDLIGSTILTGTAGLGTGFAGTGLLTSGLSSVLLNATPTFTFTSVDESIITLDHVLATQGFVNIQASSTAGGASTAALHIVDCQISATVNTTDININTYNSTLGAVNVTTSLSTETFLNGFGGYINSVNVSGVSEPSAATMEGTAVALLSLTGTVATYSATVEGIPDPSLISLFSSATNAQITRLNPPPGTYLKSTFLTSASGTFTTSALTNKIRVRGVGGGGAGGGAPAGSNSEAVGCGGGGAGGYVEGTVAVLPSTGYSFTCGAAGIGSSGSHGTSGGDSTFTITANANPPVSAVTFFAGGGSFAPIGTPQPNLTGGAAGAGGSSVSGGLINTQGQNGLPGFAQGSSSPSVLAQGVSGAGGSGPFGAGGIGVITANNGLTGTGYGSGGSGGMAGYNGSTNTACTGGNGTPACWAVDEYT